MAQLSRQQGLSSHFQQHLATLASERGNESHCLYCYMVHGTAGKQAETGRLGGRHACGACYKLQNPARHSSQSPLFKLILAADAICKRSARP